MRGCAILAVAFLAGCSGLLPKAESGTQETWADYAAAAAAIDRIQPMQTTRAELAAAGLEPKKNPAVSVLTFSDVAQRFAGTAVRLDELDEGVRRCLTSGKQCTGYSIMVRRMDSRRIGNFWLDSLNFKRETDITGWSFSALILFVDNLVVYTLYGGQPRVHEKEVARNPLGPLQGWGDQMPNLIGF
jgi:hypothetical protein